MHRLPPALEPQICEGRGLDKAMAPSTKSLLLSSSDVDQQLEPVTQHGEQPGYSSPRRNSG